MPRKTLPRLRSVTIKGKEFHRVSVPQPGGGRRLRTFKDADDAKRFYAAVQDEISRLTFTYAMGPQPADEPIEALRRGRARAMLHDLPRGRTYSSHRPARRYPLRSCAMR